QPFRKPQHIYGAVHARLRRLHGIVLVVDRGGGTGEIVDLIDLEIERKGDVVSDQLERGVADQVLYIPPRSREKIVDAENDRPIPEQALAKMGPEKAGTAGD